MSENTPRYQVRDPQGNVYGPADATMLRDWVRQGRIVAGMHIADQSDGLWVEVRVHPALADLFQGPGPAPASTPTSPTADPVTRAESSPFTPTPVSPASPITQLPADPTALNYASTGPRQNVLALLSLIAGIVGSLGLPLGCIPFCGICIGGPFVGLLAIAAIVLGAIALHQIKSDSQRYTGRGMAVAGLSIGIGIIVLYLLIFAGSLIFGVLHR